MATVAEVSVGRLTMSGLGPAAWVVEHDGLGGWFDGPPVSAEVVDRPARHGTFAAPGYRRGRVVTVDAVALAGSVADAGVRRREAAAMLGDGGYSTLTVTEPDGTVTSTEVRIDAPPLVAWRPGWDYVRAQWQFYSPDPFRYGLTNRGGSVGLPVLSGGLEFDLFTDGTADTGYLEFGDPGSSTGRIVVENDGSAPALPIIVVSGDLPDGFTVQEVNSGRRLVFSGAVTPGTPMGVDMATGRVLAGASVDTSGRFDLLGSADRSGRLVVREFSPVPPGGSAEFAFQSASFDPTAVMTVFSQDTYW